MRDLPEIEPYDITMDDVLEGGLNLALSAFQNSPLHQRVSPQQERVIKHIRLYGEDHIEAHLHSLSDPYSSYDDRWLRDMGIVARVEQCAYIALRAALVQWAFDYEIDVIFDEDLEDGWSRAEDWVYDTLQGVIMKAILDSL